MSDPTAPPSKNIDRETPRSVWQEAGWPAPDRVWRFEEGDTLALTDEYGEVFVSNTPRSDEQVRDFFRQRGWQVPW